MTLREALMWGRAMISPLLPLSASSDAELLLCAALDRTSAHLVAHSDDEMSEADYATFAQWISRRMRHEPIQYITGRAYFWGLEFHVTPATLIPRPETELMVERALALLDVAPAAVIDVGTGSGCIAIALAHERPNVQVLALDISSDALAVARENATSNNVHTIHFSKNNLLADADEFLPEGRLILTMNLPYLSEVRMRGLAPEVALYEPHSALTAGPDGLDCYRDIFGQIANLNRKEITLLCEIDPEQTDVFTMLANKYFSTAKVAVHQDYHNDNRLIEITL